MPSSSTIPISIFALFAALVSARTDLTGCTTTGVSSPAGASVAWYVPGTGELCDFLDCGGGRAPPKYNVPGCPQYTGTDTYSPSYLAGYAVATASATAVDTSSASAPVETSSTSAPVETSYATAHVESTASGLLAPTLTSGFDTTVTGTATPTVTASDMPLICGLAATSDPNCGVSWSTTTSYETTTSSATDSTDGVTFSSTTSSGQSTGASTTASTGSQVSGSSTRGTTSTRATSSQSSQASGSASGASSGVAAQMTGVVGGLGFVFAAVGAVAIL